MHKEAEDKHCIPAAGDRRHPAAPSLSSGSLQLTFRLKSHSTETAFLCPFAVSGVAYDKQKQKLNVIIKYYLPSSIWDVNGKNLRVRITSSQACSSHATTKPLGNETFTALSQPETVVQGFHFTQFLPGRLRATTATGQPAGLPLL